MTTRTMALRIAMQTVEEWVKEGLKVEITPLPGGWYEIRATQP